MTYWRRLGAIEPTALGETRETLHHAAQLLALVGAAALAPRPDDSHTSLTWLDDHAALVTERIDAPRQLRIALRVPDLTLLALDGTDDVTARCTLPGRTRSDALGWLSGRLGDAGLDPARLGSSLHFTIAPHATDAGEPFHLPTDGSLAELARWFASASLLLERRRAAMPDAGPVRCWPHHFDIATLVTLVPGSVSGPLRTIGIGLSPGDEQSAEPYFYVGPYPHPAVTPPPLAIGAWHTAGWWGAELRGSVVVAAGGAPEQETLVSRFVDDAVAALLAGAGAS